MANERGAADGKHEAFRDPQTRGYSFAPSPLQTETPLQGPAVTPINRSAIYGTRTTSSTMAITDLALRAAAAVLLLIGLSVVATASFNDGSGNTNNFTDLAGLRYVFSVALIGLLYSLYQAGAALFLFFTGKSMIPEEISRYCSFFGDQVLAYLLISGGSAGAAVITLYQDGCNTAGVNFCAQSAGGISMVFIAFVVVGTSSMLSTHTFFKHLFS